MGAIPDRRDGNLGAHDVRDVVTEPLVLGMRAYDALPPALRRRLAEARFSFSAMTVDKALRAYRTQGRRILGLKKLTPHIDRCAVAAVIQDIDRIEREIMERNAP